MDVVFSDTFTDSDGTTLASHTPTVGTSYTVLDYTVLGAYTAEIKTNRLRTISPGYGSFYLWKLNPGTAFASDHTISFTYGANIGNNGIADVRFRTRVQGSGAHYAFVLSYSHLVSYTSVDAKILYVDSVGAETTVASGTFAPSAYAGDTIECIVSGSSLAMKRNGSALISGTNATIGTSGDLHLRVEVNSFDDSAQIDTLSVDNAAGGGDDDGLPPFFFFD